MPTEHQPGQFATVVENIPVGKKTITHFTGLVSSGEKATILSRVDTLLRATKQARQRANTVKVDTNFRPGEAITNFLLNGQVD